MATIDWAKLAESEEQRRRKARTPGAGTSLAPVPETRAAPSGLPEWAKPRPIPSPVADMAPPSAVEAPAPAVPAGAGNLLVTEGRPRLPPPSYEQPRIFTDSDGRARAGFNMGEDGRRLGLVDADAAGVPLGIGMVPVQGLSQGSAEVGRDLRLGPPAPAVLTPPPAPPTTADWARSANAIGGYQAPPMNAREAARMADLDATRAARWDQRGSTTQVDRAVGQIRSQGAALDALTRQTNEQIRLAQGTPQVAGAAGSGVMGWNPQTRRFDMLLPPPEQVKQTPIEERLKNVADAIKAVSGGTIDSQTAMSIGLVTDEARRKELLQAATRGNPEAAALLGRYLAALLPEYAAGATGGGTGTGGAGTGGKINRWQDDPGTGATPSAFDKYRRR